VTTAALPDDPTAAETCEALYRTLPADRQAALRTEAVASLVQKGYHRDYLTMLILPEVCHLLATQAGCAVAPVPRASAVGSSPPPSVGGTTLTPTPAGGLPTQHTPHATPTPGGHRSGKAKPKARLPAPTRSHLLREDLEEMSRLLVVYIQAIARGEIGRSDADRLKFCAEAKHALRCGADPQALFADNLRHQRWQYDQTDEDTARRQLTAHLYGIEEQRTAPPLPASEPPTLSKDAWCVRELQRDLARHGVQGDVWAHLHRENPTHWTDEHCHTIARELARYQQACQHATALGRLGEIGPEENWPTGLWSDDAECAECGDMEDVEDG
jgi:hypothetical protein